jgi:hypothetical protein
VSRTSTCTHRFGRLLSLILDSWTLTTTTVTSPSAINDWLQETVSPQTLPCLHNSKGRCTVDVTWRRMQSAKPLFKGWDPRGYGITCWNIEGTVDGSMEELLIKDSWISEGWTPEALPRWWTGRTVSNFAMKGARSQNPSGIVPSADSSLVGMGLRSATSRRTWSSSV